MRFNFVFAILAVVAMSSVSTAQVIISTSFENDATGAQYVDTGDPSVDHDLINNAGEADVDSTNTVGDLSFDASYVNSRGGVGLTDGDFVGVTDFTGTVESFSDGTQGYQISDADGQFDLTFGTVDLSGFSTPVTVSIDYFLAETGYEADDVFRVGLDLDGTIVDLLNTAGSDINDLGIEGSFNTLTSTFSDVSEATLFVEFDSNSGAEAVFLDNVVFAEGVAVPEPSSTTVLGLIGLVGIARRRRR